MIEPDSKNVSGVDLVTIPLSHYAELLECKKALALRTLSHEQFARGRRSAIERDPEVAVFLIHSFGLKPLRTSLKECKKKFGSTRTPSMSAAYRYWQKVRLERRKSDSESVAN